MSTQSAWDIFYSVNFSFPVVIFSVFLIFSLIYWCVAVLGLVDIEVFDVDTDVDADLDVSPDVGSVSGLLMRLGLNGVPLTIIISLISFFGWLLSSITVYYVMPMVPTLVLKIVVGCVILLAALYLSVYATAFSIKPIRPSRFRIISKKRLI